MTRWTEHDIPDLMGRTAVVTGANSGLGYQTARLLAAHGARVVAACRNPEGGAAAIRRIQAEQPTARLDLETLDLADLDSVTAFANRLHETLDRIDLLVLNAGVMVPPEGRTKQGFELQIGVNYLGHFALTARLLDLVERGTDPRIVAVSSTAAQRGEIHFDDLNFEHGYNAWAAYGQSKLAMQLFVLELQRRLTAAGSGVKAIAAHPGWTRTDLQRTARFARTVNPIVAMKPEQGVSRSSEPPWIPTPEAAPTTDQTG